MNDKQSDSINSPVPWRAELHRELTALAIDAHNLSIDAEESRTHEQRQSLASNLDRLSERIDALAEMLLEGPQK